jgi:hypothetical protein
MKLQKPFCHWLLVAFVFISSAAASTIDNAAFYAKGVDYFQQGRYQHAFASFKEAAKSGHAPSMNNCGYMTLFGMGHFPDEDRALEWFKKSATNGNHSAMFNIGMCYWYGFGLVPDKKKAHHWFNLLKKQGHAGAVYFLEYMKLHGINDLTPEQWFEMDTRLIKAKEITKNSAPATETRITHKEEINPFSGNEETPPVVEFEKVAVLQPETPEAQKAPLHAILSDGDTLKEVEPQFPEQEIIYLDEPSKWYTWTHPLEGEQTAGLGIYGIGGMGNGSDFRLSNEWYLHYARQIPEFNDRQLIFEYKKSSLSGGDGSFSRLGIGFKRYIENPDYFKKKEYLSDLSSYGAVLLERWSGTVNSFNGVSHNSGSQSTTLLTARLGVEKPINEQWNIDLYIETGLPASLDFWSATGSKTEVKNNSALSLGVNYKF